MKPPKFESCVSRKHKRERPCYKCTAARAIAASSKVAGHLQLLTARIGLAVSEVIDTEHQKVTGGGNTANGFGLVAEEVEKINPDLVVWEGRPYSVRYDKVNAMLLMSSSKSTIRMKSNE